VNYVRLSIAHLPGRNGWYLIAEENDTITPVARLWGVTPENQEESRRILLAWSAATNAGLS
jgi:hypothetical protein